MTNFHFRLQPLLQLRESARDQARSALADAFRQADALREQLQTIEQQEAEVVGLLHGLMAAQEIDIDGAAQAQRHRLWLQGAQAQTEEHIQQANAEIERRRQAVVEADRQVKVLEKLRDKQRQRHEHQQHMREVAQTDEMALRTTTLREAAG